MRVKSFNTLHIAIFFILSFFVFNFAVNVVNADDPGVIDTSATNQAKVCHNVACDDFGIINFELVGEDSIIIDGDNGISGNIWGNELGWINMNPTGSTGVTFANSSTGVLTGFAWSQVSGWINFSPTNEGVTINPNTGEFEGYAWSGGAYGGWIKFDCSDSSTCVKTTWRHNTTITGGGCGGKCTTCPPGFVLVSGQCLHVDPPYDYCPNINEVQTSIPNGMHLNNSGQCVNNDTGCVGPGCTPPDDDECPSGWTGVYPSCVPPPCVGPDCVPPDDDECPSGWTGVYPSCVPPPCVGPDCVPPPPCVGLGCTTDGGCVGPNCIVDNGCVGPECNIIDEVEIIVLDLIDKLTNFIKSPNGNLATKFVSTLGLISGLVATFTGIFSFTDIGLNLLRLWSFFLYGMGFKKRNRPWGVVYDSVTKQPLDPAYVVLKDIQGVEVASSITDLDGRYGFLVSPGFYKITASKTNYTYPSIKLRGRTYDELYNDLYFGEQIEIKEEGEIIAKNIPLDQINFDWNEFAKKEQKRMKFYHTRDVLLARFSDFMFLVGFIVSIIILFVAPKPYNVIIFSLYIVLLLVRRTTVKRNRKGRVVYKADNTPISYGIMRVRSMESGQEVAHRVLDKTGGYYCIVPNGIYNANIEKKNDDGSYERIFTSDNFEIKNGILKKNFKI